MGAEAAISPTVCRSRIGRVFVSSCGSTVPLWFASNAAAADCSCAQ
jgi:hypothetical protein